MRHIPRNGAQRRLVGTTRHRRCNALWPRLVLAVALSLSVALAPLGPAHGILAPSTSSVSSSASSASSASAAGAERTLPPGWSLAPTDGGVQLTYRASGPIPRTDARVQVVADGRDLGPVTVRDNTARLVVSQLPANPATLEVRIGSRPLESFLASGAATPRLPSSAAASSLAPAPDTAAVPAALTPQPPEPVTAVDYLLTPLPDPEAPVPVQVLARIIAPRVPRADRPLVLFVHGRHETCYRRGESSGAYPCPAGWRSLPSLLGYQYAQRALAAQGFVTVSIDLNGVNAQDDLLDDGGSGMRSRLIRHHLSQLAAWNADPASAPFAARLSLRFNPRHVLLVGHSRGGEGVLRATASARPEDPFSVAGLLLLAPTNFGRQSAPRTPTVVLLPACDGDVSDLQGQIAVDRALDARIPTALHSAVYVPGANHNFFNSEWTPGTARAPAFDDGEGSGCPATTRLPAASVRSVGATYALASALALLQRHAGSVELLDGSGPTAVGLAAPGILVSPVGGPRKLLWRGNVTGTPQAEVAGGRVCQGISEQPQACAAGDPLASPHWLGVSEVDPPAARLHLGRTGAHARLRFTDPVDVADASHLDLRVIAVPRTAGRLAVRLEDTQGRTVTVTPSAGASVRGLPAAVPRQGDPGGPGRYWGQLVRVPLAPAAQAGLTLRSLRSVSLVTPGGGLDGAVLLDVSGAQPGLGSSAEGALLPRLDPQVTNRSVAEGDTRRTESVGFDLSVPAPVDLEVIATVVGQPLLASWQETPIVQRLRLAAGQTRLEVPVTVTGNRVFNEDRAIHVAIQVNGPAVTDGWISRLDVVDDDEKPRLTITPTARAPEGRPLVWTATLDRVSGEDVLLELSAKATRRELAANDLTPTARRDWNVDASVPNRPLSGAGLRAWYTIPAGTRSLQLVMGIAKDRRREGLEQVHLVGTVSGVADPRRISLTGTVTD